MKLLITFIFCTLFTVGCTKNINSKKMPGVNETTETTTNNDNLISRSCLFQPANSTGGTEYSTDNVFWHSCSGFICNMSYTNVGGSCVLINQTRACATQPSNSTGGTEATSDGGLSWGACTSYTCDNTYVNVGGICTISNTSRSCVSQPLNSTGGLEYSADGGVSYGSCSGFSCNASYSNVSGSCNLSSQTRSCLSQPSNSTGGTESTSNGGATWGTCSGYSCSASYTNVGGVCNQTSQTRACISQPSNSSSGTEATSDGGQTWGACSGYSCNASYTNVSGTCNLTSQTRSCVSQPSNSTSGTEATSDGGSTWASCSGFTCSAGYTSNGVSCLINTYSLTVNKLTNIGRVVDTSLAKIDCLNNCTSQTESYDQGTMIVLDATPAAGYTITGWTGCDSVSGDNLTCTISSIQSNRTITPVFEETYQTISASWANASIGAASAGYDIYKNGALCTTTCLSEVKLTDTIRVVANVGSFLEDVSSFGTTGSPSSIDTSTTNEISFTMGSQNVAVSITAIDKDVSVLNSNFMEVTLRINTSDLSFLGSNNAGVSYFYYSEANPVRHRLSVSNTYLLYDREIDIFDDLTCTNKLTTISTVAQNAVYNNFDFNLNSSSTYSFKIRNVTKESSCIKYTLYHESAITKTIETTVMNKVIETTGYDSFFTDDVNTVEGVCKNINSLSNPSMHTYNYGKVIKTSGVDIIAEAYMNADLTTPYYTQTKTTSCAGAGEYSETITQNSNFTTANVIKIKVKYTDSFGAILVDTKTMNIKTKTQACAITNGVGSQTYNTNGAYNTCTLVSCDGGYNQSGNTCVAAVSSITEKLQLGYNSLSFLTKNGVVLSMGENSNQLLGDGSASHSNDSKTIIPLKTSGAMANKKIKEFARGGSVACAITADGLGYCWGTNTDGALGDGTNNSSTEPVAIKMSGELTGKTLKKISAGYATVCAISSDDKAYCWGYGNLGNNTYAPNPNEPRKVDDSGVLSGKIITQIEVGDDAVCVLTSESLHYCWGSRGWGLIPSATSSTNTPIQTRMTGVMVGKTYKKLAMRNGSQGGMGFACGILSDDKAYCWGYNGSGQLGNNSTTNSTFQVAVDESGVLSGKTIKEIAVGGSHACALTTDENIACWGRNISYQVSEDAINESLVPVLKPKNGLLAGKSFSKLQLGANETCVLTTDNEWLCWGSVLASVSTATAIYLKPELLFVSPDRNGKFSIHKDNGCSIDSSQNLYCWGRNNLGTIGDATNTDSDIPVRTNTQGLLNGKKFKQVSVGENHACAIDTAGVAYCWGDNNFGQLGNGTYSTTNTAVAVDFSSLYMVSTVEQISAGYNYTCAIIMSNSKRVTSCWGKNNYGQLGNSSTTTSNIPVTITEHLTLASAYKPLEITTAQETVCMIAMLDGELRPRPFCWGRNNTTQGYLGMNNGALTQRTHPQAVYNSGVLNNKSTRQIAGDSSSGTFCVISDDYKPFCWGTSSDGQLGNGTWSQSIVPVSPDLTGVLSGKKIISIETGTAHTCALTDTNTLHCWGRGANGQLGDNLASASPVPVNVVMNGSLSGKDVVGLVSGFYNTCALTKDGQAHCWGWNNSAQFGLSGDFSQYDAPTRAVNSLLFDF